MPAASDVRGMQDILDKLNSAAAAHPFTDSNVVNESNTQPSASSANVSTNAREMYDILAKLEKATSKAAVNILKESEHDTPLIAATAVQTHDTIEIAGKYKIELVEKYVIDTVKKKFYNIKDSTDTLVHEDIALFESAMGIVKHLMFKNNTGKIEKIVRLDERYASYLAEAAMYKFKTITLTEDYKIDVALAKQGNAVSKLTSIKKQIKSLL